VDISWNAPGCNPSEEVLVACEVVGIENYFRPNGQVQLTINPNPFTRQTILEFTLQQSGPVYLAIYNQLGERVAVPVVEYKPAGVHKVIWNAAGLP
jgi:hypothetical protein